MKRIEFITQLAGMAGIGGMIPAALKKTEAKTKGYTLYEGWVAGYAYYEGPGIEKSLHPGQPLTLTREPENRYDARAIEIHAGGSKLGYIAQADNHVLSALMDQGAPLRAEVAEVNPDNSIWNQERLKIRVGFGRKWVAGRGWG